MYFMLNIKNWLNFAVGGAIFGFSRIVDAKAYLARNFDFFSLYKKLMLHSDVLFNTNIICFSGLNAGLCITSKLRIKEMLFIEFQIPYLFQYPLMPL